MMTIEDIKKLIAKDETRTLELKKTTGELVKGMETACAFLNSDGGWLLFGVAPSLKIEGQMVTDNTRKEIANALRKIDLTNVPQDVPQDVPQEILSQLSERQIEILKMIMHNPKVTREEMSLKVNKSSKTIARDLDEIRKFLKIAFVGTPSDGMWIIAKE
jgi:Predicted transcriptional regulator containing an HTH domain and an uncharacterized domain shared with the mammalian protein Schlafen